MNKALARVLRLIALVLMGLTAAMTLLSGIGTTCVAFGAENYESMAALVPYKTTYQAFVFLTLAVALAAIVETVGLIRSKKWAFVAALVTLIAGMIVAGVHMSYSTRLRGSSAPGNLRFYLSIITLVALLILRIPTIWKHITHSDKPGSAATPAGLAMIAAGIVTATASIWAGPTHFLGGYNWVNVLLVPLVVGGCGMVAGGIGLLVAGKLVFPSVQAEHIPAKETS